jgi:hypothetical protein
MFYFDPTLTAVPEDQAFVFSKSGRHVAHDGDKDNASALGTTGSCVGSTGSGDGIHLIASSEDLAATFSPAMLATSLRYLPQRRNASTAEAPPPGALERRSASLVDPLQLVLLSNSRAINSSKGWISEAAKSPPRASQPRAQDRAGRCKLVTKPSSTICKPHVRQPQCDIRMTPDDTERFMAQRAAMNRCLTSAECRALFNAAEPPRQVK